MSMHELWTRLMTHHLTECINFIYQHDINKMDHVRHNVDPIEPPQEVQLSLNEEAKVLNIQQVQKNKMRIARAARWDTDDTSHDVQYDNSRQPSLPLQMSLRSGKQPLVPLQGFGLMSM